MDCKSLDQRGLFPGPDETEEEFKERARKLRNSKAEDHEGATIRLVNLFACQPDWVPVQYGNKGLSLWEGAATWVEKGTVRIQLKNGFKKGVYLGLYRRDEVLAHELVHLTRMAFEEPVYEEVFAYLTAKSKLRRMFGPLFRRPFESTLFVVTSFLPLLAIALGNADLFPLLWSIPLAYFSFLGLRLALSQRKLTKCLKNLPALVDNPLALALRLTDKEISLFSRLKPDQITAYIHEQTSFRWSFLRSAATLRLS